MKYCIFAIILLLTGCASVQTQQEWERINQFSVERTGIEIIWEQSEKDAMAVKEEVKRLVSDGITMDEAVKIALLNNRKLQASFEEIGIAKADLAQAGLFTNPNLSAIFRFPFGGGGTGIETAGLLNIADFWQIPIRKKVAAARLESIMLQVSEEILNTAAEAKKAYINYSALSLVRDEMEKIKDHTEEWRDHLIYRQQFGYASNLDIYIANALFVETELEFAKIESELLISRYRLNRILGLSPDQYNYELSDVLSEEINQLPELEQLISYALSNRPDIQTARLHIENARKVLALERSRIFSNVEAGAVYEKGIDGDESIGPEIGIHLPIFDQNQAQIAKAEYRLRQAEKELKAKIQEVREDVSVAYERHQLLSQQINLIKTQILPAHAAAVEYTEKYFNAMQLNMLYLLEARKRLIETKRHYFNALKEYHEQVVELERIIGRAM